MEIRKTAEEVIRQICGAEDICGQSLLKEDLGMDSLGMVTMLVLLEDAFGIEFDESDMDPFEIETVEDVFALVEKYAADAGFGDDECGSCEKCSCVDFAGSGPAVHPQNEGAGTDAENAGRDPGSCAEFSADAPASEETV